MSKQKTASEHPGAPINDPEHTKNIFNLSGSDWSKLTTDLQLALMEAAAIFSGQGNKKSLFIMFASDYDGSNFETLVWADDLTEAFKLFYETHQDIDEWNQPPHGYRLPFMASGEVSKIIMWHTLEHSYSDPIDYQPGQFEEEDDFDPEP